MYRRRRWKESERMAAERRSQMQRPSSGRDNAVDPGEERDQLSEIETSH